MMSIEQLCGELSRLSALYYAGNPEVSDAEFDVMRDLLRETVTCAAVSEHERALAEATLAAIGAPAFGTKVKHLHPFGSLDKDTAEGSVDNVIKWMDEYKQNQVVISWKVDGCSLEVRYRNGYLTQAITRGDGIEGQDVTANAKMIVDIPHVIPEKEPVDIRMEVIMPKTVFAALNRELAEGGKPLFANPRNAATGSLLQKDPQVTRARQLRVLAWDIFQERVFGNEYQKFVAMALLFVPAVPRFITGRGSVPETIAKLEAMRTTIDFNVDGLVIAFSSLEAQAEAGSVNDRPKGKIAFKFAPVVVTSGVLAIDYQVGRTGKLTPMARIKPVWVDGSTVSNVTLHNEARIAMLGISVGATVSVAKGGDIIPGIVGVLQKGPHPHQPAMFCPACSSVLELDAKGVSLWCTNGALCSAQRINNLLHFVQTVGIMELGEGIIEKLVASEVALMPSQLYRMSPDAWAVVCGSRKTAEVIVAQIQRHRTMPLATFLAALGIPSLGIGTAEALATKYQFLQSVLLATVEDMITVDGIGTLTAQRIVSGLRAYSVGISRLLDFITIDEPKAKPTGKLSGKSFVITGTFSQPRSSLVAEIESAGGTVQDSVKKGLTYLLQADPNSTTSKSTAAKKLGIPIINEATFSAML